MSHEYDALTEVLATLDVDALIAFQQKNQPELATPPRDSVEISMHKARTGTVELPMADRSYSKKWLLDRGYKSWDCGDVPLPLEN